MILAALPYSSDADRKSTRLNSSHRQISYAVFCLKKKVLVCEANATIGVGARSAELTLSGFVHDVCSAVHPLAAGSPFFKTLPLERFGLEWIQPEVPLAHPLDDGSAACLHRDVDFTAEQLTGDSGAYRRVMKPLARDWEKLANEFLQPVLHLPRHPVALARLGIPAGCPATF